MKRRTFLLAASGVGLLSATGTLGQAMKQGGMGNMSMDGMSMPGTAMDAGPNGVPTLPEGKPFADILPLLNYTSQPGAFSSSLTAAPATTEFLEGVETAILAYNGQTPGPLIAVTEGDQVRIHFKNEIPNEPSTIHWHGIPVPADQDGNPMEPVASGEAHDYVFTIPEGSAGSYWYHPHPHGLTASQVYRGLAGPLVIRSRIDPVPASYGDTILFMTDLRVASDGTMPESTSTDAMNGRVGDHVLVNGLKNPVLSVASGSSRRFRLYNATNARYLHLSFGGLPITIIGTDGGLLQSPRPPATEILLAPAERLEIVVAFEGVETAKLTTLAYDRGWMGAGRPADAGMTLLTVKVDSSAMIVAEPLPQLLRAIAPLGTPALTRKLVLGETMAMGSGGMGMDFTINGNSFDMSRIDFTAKVGDVELWEISNPTDMDHPFHIHGTQFQVVDVTANGVTIDAPDLAWKDTVNVPRAAIVQIAVRQALPGLRMFHCHILEHEQLGMMGIVDLRA